MPSDCWAWGVQQHLSRRCAVEVTAFVRCCRSAGEDARALFPPSLAPEAIPAERTGGSCAVEHAAAVRCVASALFGPEHKFCQKSFEAVVLDNDGPDGAGSTDLLERALRCAWQPKYFRQPLDQLVAQSQAVGECRPAAPVQGTGGKGRWTAGGS
eukprot:TRINITY_DN52084_c0_g1_i1.p2 TRINITY_DN52084_c0_g1~~TRINITY_DN52084_c0_g1_i1.p2  ORF type:complete len:155 (-),score=26.03 TRINITY_DN52084_c0_g1_i1:226-690(-)